MTIERLTVEPGDTSEYELAVVARATLVGEAGPVAIERRYQALPRQNDTVDRDAIDIDDELLADAASVHVHTKFYAVEGAEGPEGDPRTAVDAGSFLRDDHTRWEPTDPSVLTDGASFEAACRGHVDETAGATYDRGADAL